MTRKLGFSNKVEFLSVSDIGKCSPPSTYIGTKIEFFQWAGPLESQAVVWIETRKPETEPETAIQDLASPFSRVRIWILQKLTVTSYSPHSSTYFGEYNFNF